MAYNYYFDPNNTFQRRLVEHEISRQKPLLFILNIILIVLGLSSIVIIITALFGWYSPSPAFFGSAVIIFVLFINLIAYHIFYYHERRHLEVDFKLSEAIEELNKCRKINLAELLSLTATDLYRCLNKETESITLKDYLKNFIAFKEIDFMIERMGASKEEFMEQASDELVKNEEIIFESLRIAAAENHKFISIGDVFAALCLKIESLQRLLFFLHLKDKDMLNIIYWQTQVLREKKKKLFDPEYLVLNGGIGRDWAFGYTPNLNRFSHDITDIAASPNLDLHRVGYENEISALEKALVTSSTKNAILVGEPGIGKKTIVYSFAERVYAGRTYGILANKHILELDLGAALAGARTEGEISGRLHTIF